MELTPDAFEYLHPGRRLVFTYPLVHLSNGEPELAGESISVSVLDFALEREGEVVCAAMLVPRGKEEDWVYCSEGGQWQLLSSAGISRLIIVSRDSVSQGVECGRVGESREERKRLSRKIDVGTLENGEDGHGYRERLLSLEKRERRNGREARRKAEVSETSEISSGVGHGGQNSSGDGGCHHKKERNVKVFFHASLGSPERGDVRDERGNSTVERYISGAEIGRRESKQDGSMGVTKNCRGRKSSERDRKRSMKFLRGLDAERGIKNGKGEWEQRQRTRRMKPSEDVETYEMKEHRSWAEKGRSHFKKDDATNLVKGGESPKDQGLCPRTIHEIGVETQILRQKCNDSSFKDNRIRAEKVLSQPKQIVRNGEREEFQGARTNICEEVHIKHAEILGHVCKYSSCEDELFEKRLGSLVVALAPQICFSSGLPFIPFVSYTDNIVHRAIVEEAYSPLTGHMMVEDVALGENSIELGEDNNSALLSKDFELPQMSNTCRVCGDSNVKIVWRRRLRFRRMPNHIQTEVALIFPLELDPQKSVPKGLPGHHKSSRPRVHLCNCLNRTCWADPYAKGDSRGNMSIDHETQTEDGILKSNQISGTRNTDANSGVLFEETLSCAQVDHSQLVHRYLPPIVAGLVLVASCIESCKELGKQVKVLTLGVGGGALPTFLHRHFGFHVQAVDLDKVVLDLARRHFGLVEDKLMKLEVGNALHIINKIATEVADLGASSNPPMASRQKAAGVFSASGSNLDPDTTAPPHSRMLYFPGKEVFNKSRDETTQQSTSSSNTFCLSCKTANPGCLQSLCDLCDPRFHVIVIDVDEGDARLGLSSPPLSFLDHTFLTQTKIALHIGGMVAINVVPNGKQSSKEVITALSSVFDEVYETVIDGDVNRVVFALPVIGTGLDLDCPYAGFVKNLLSDTQLLTRIHKVF